MTRGPDERERVLEEARRGAVLFDMAQRGLLEVGGSDRTRWLDGMISGDVEALERGASGSGCYATLLTNRGAIVADLHVGRLGEVYLLESLASEMPRIRATLEKFVIADDVTLVDRSADFAVLGLEGPRAAEVLEAAFDGAIRAPGAEAWVAAPLGSSEVWIAGFGWSGERAFQLRVAPAERERLEQALDRAGRAVLGGADALLRGDAGALEVLRVEAGIPLLGAELDEQVLPPEARLDHAIATRKGCYVGQEIVARLRSRGQVNHLLVGLRLPEADAALAVPGTELIVDGRRSGELTSVARSPRAGAIALGFLRREHAEPGTSVGLGESEERAVVAGLPFVASVSEAQGDPPSEGSA